MAEAKKTSEVIRRDLVVLTMTTDEANTLRAVLRHVAGDPLGSPRKHVDSISDALIAARVDGGDERNLITRQMGKTGLEFRPYGSSAPSYLDGLVSGTQARKNWGSIV
jgi:hypothetical protein